MREIKKETDENLSVFNVDTFHERYHRKSSLLDVLNSEADAETLDREIVEPIFVNDQAVDELAPLTDKEKFRKLMTILNKIANIVCQHSTNQFYKYLEDFEKIQNYVRRGDTIFEEVNYEATADDLAPINTEYDDTEVERTDTEVDINENNTENVVEEITTVQEQNLLDLTLPQATRFSTLQMKEKVKTKGRPKGSSKQLTFKKTVADRKVKTAKKPKQKKSRRQLEKEDFIEEEESDSSMHLDDDSDEDIENEDYEDEDLCDSSGEITFNTIVASGRRKRKSNGKNI